MRKHETPKGEENRIDFMGGQWVKTTGMGSSDGNKEEMQRKIASIRGHLRAGIKN